jgi:hypothetical protein
MPNVLNGNEHPRGGDDNAVFLEGSLVPQRIEYSIAAGGADVCEVTLAAQDGHGNPMTVPVLLNLWLSDAAAGAGLTATSASGTVQAKSASGVDFGVLTAKKALVVQTKADGTYILEITDSAKTGFYVGAELPFAGLPVVSRQLVTGDYGS